ncbi:hypothetical protein MLD38_002578 [Melastoma candidum]|uniref:Uncharacterized protein n=1 Tax=Melastoma candidum TaxID=119954 RepID=A0ACB9S000_9MYRT|nr:hypothetical protein MLD38_002578 [Melastoma candidum]
MTGIMNYRVHLLRCKGRPGKIADNLFEVSRPAPLETVHVEERPLSQDDGSLKQVQSTVKNEDVDSPGTATSKYDEQSFLAHHASGETSPQLMDLDNVDAAVTSCEGRKKSDNLVITGGEEAEPSASKCDSKFLENSGAESLMSEGDRAGQRKDGGIMTEDSIVSEFIIATNKETARRASEVFDKLLPDGECKVDTSCTAGSTALQIDSLILRKLATRKQYSRFKERVLALKYKAFGQLWKEDLHQLALRKCRAKSQKKCDSSLRVSMNGNQKHRSSIRLRIASPGTIYSPLFVNIFAVIM